MVYSAQTARNPDAAAADETGAPLTPRTLLTPVFLQNKQFSLFVRSTRDRHQVPTANPFSPTELARHRHVAIIDLCRNSAALSCFGSWGAQSVPARKHTPILLLLFLLPITIPFEPTIVQPRGLVDDKYAAQAVYFPLCH